jgi:hypothetical protein
MNHGAAIVQRPEILTDFGPLAMGDGDWLLTDSDGGRHVVTDGEHSLVVASRARPAPPRRLIVVSGTPNG